MSPSSQLELLPLELKLPVAGPLLYRAVAKAALLLCRGVLEIKAGKMSFLKTQIQIQFSLIRIAYDK